MSRAERAQRVQDALRQVGLPPEVAESKPMQLSGGQRQRAALARATVVPPDVLLCDEPTSALDVSLAATVLNLIGQLRRDLGMAVMFVTHDLAAARVVADRIAVMYLGRIVELGPSDEICAEPRPPLHPGPSGRGARPGTPKGPTGRGAGERVGSPGRVRVPPSLPRGRRGLRRSSCSPRPLR